ncbi:MAG: chalcone isomerase family protein [Spirochaetes bacterium]|nr:chalcone isomerase family protein [Spirochaetota bacterium]
MKKLGLFVILATMIISFSASDGFAFKLGGKEMVKNGSGIRTKSIFGTLYYLTLSVPASLQGKDAKTIIEANQPMSMILVIDSRLVTRERFVDTVNDGFAKAASSGYVSPKKQAFMDQFNDMKFSKGDIVYMNYTPDGLVTTFKFKDTGKTKVLGTIKGLDLKKALYAIWLGPDPVQESLKKALLEGK